jgi:hypothetical protein
MILGENANDIFPLVGYIEPFRKHSRRIEVRRTPEDRAAVTRWDNGANGERVVAWVCKDRTPEWFMSNNVPSRWVRP